MGVTRFKGPLIVGGPILAAGTTVFNQAGGSAATNLGKRGSLIAVSGISTAGTINAAGGFGMVAGNYKRIAVGTYIGSGAATAAIVSTGLTTIHHVILQRNWRSRTAGATTRAGYMPSPALAVGTPGSFYPLVGFIAPAAVVNFTLGIGAGATFSWMAVGA